MNGSTHLGAGVALGAALSLRLDLPLEETIVSTATAMIASLLPDLDTTTSILGRALFPLSWLVNHFIGHRTAFHSVITWSAVVTGAALALPEFPAYTAALALGVASHLLLDLLNPSGLILLWPIPMRLSLSICRSGGMVDKALGKLFFALGGCEATLYVLHILMH